MIGTRRNRFLCGRGLFIWTLAFGVPAVAPASIIFTNFSAGLTFSTSGGNSIGNALDGNNYAEGDTFRPTANANFGSVAVALSCSFGCPIAANFTIALDADAGDQPGAAIETFSFPATTLGLLGTDITPVKATSVLKPLLMAGTQYWITVASSTNYSITWNWNSTGDTADEAISTDGGTTWFSPSGLTPGAFEVDSTTPEPAAWLLLSGGLLLVVLRRTTGTLVEPLEEITKRFRELLGRVA